MFDPRGPLPSAVYWRRRGVAAGTLMLVVAATTWGTTLLASAGSGSPDPADAAPKASSRPAAASDAQARPGPPARPQPVPECETGVLEVHAEVDKPSYQVGKPVRLAMVVTNTGDRACRVNIGAKHRALIISTAAQEQVWSSDHCHQYTTNETPVLQPGKSARNELTWFGYTSASGCSADRSTLPAGQYTVTAKFDKLTSPPTEFRLNP